MKAVRSLSLVFCLGAVLVALSPQARANAWDKRSVITISQPLDVSGTVLKPGKHVLRLADSAVDRHIVRIFNGDETKLEATVLAFPEWRATPASTTQFAYWEMPAGQPEALKSWYYPGDLYGQGFHRPPLVPVSTTAQTEPIPQPAAPQEQPQPQQQTQVTPPEQPVQPPEQAQNEQPAPMPEATPEEQPTPAKSLPKTASPYPLVGLAGLMALGAALGTRAVKRMV